MTTRTTKHGADRAIERGIPIEAIPWIRRCGTKIYKREHVYEVAITPADISSAYKSLPSVASLIRDFLGMAIILDEQTDEIITTYWKNRHWQLN